MSENLSPEYHHPLSMSKAARWMACGGSVEACEGIKDRPNSAAQFGNDVHDVVARALKGNLSNCATLTSDEKTLEVADKALAALRTLFPASAMLLIEERVYLPLTVTKFPPLSGTLDLGAWQHYGKLQIIDLKTGYVDVPVKKNKQLLGYALGALEKLNPFERATIDKVELIIVQVNDRVGLQIKRWELSVHELETTYKQLYQEAVTRVETNPSLRVAGPHCTDTYCPAAPTCEALKAYLSSKLETDLEAITEGFLQKADNKVDKEMSAEKLAQFIEAADVLEDLVKQVKSLSLSRMREGEAVPGYKLARSYGHKKFTPEGEKEVIAQAEALGVLDKIRTLKSPSQVAKIAKEIDQSGTWIKPEGDWKIAKDTDDAVEFLDD